MDHCIGCNTKVACVALGRCVARGPMPVRLDAQWDCYPCGARRGDPHRGSCNGKRTGNPYLYDRGD